MSDCNLTVKIRIENTTIGSKIASKVWEYLGNIRGGSLLTEIKVDENNHLVLWVNFQVYGFYKTKWFLDHLEKITEEVINETSN